MPAELDHFTGFCERHLRLEDGRPLVVEEFQRRMLGDYFDGTTETVVLVSKKNGKATLVGALALYELVTVPDLGVQLANREHVLGVEGLVPSWAG